MGKYGGKLKLHFKSRISYLKFLKYLRNRRVNLEKGFLTRFFVTKGQSLYDSFFRFRQNEF